MTRIAHLPTTGWRQTPFDSGGEIRVDVETNAWRVVRKFDALAVSGLAGSLAVGGVVLGYYFTYWAGLADRLKKHRVANRWHAVGTLK
ncbi:MAG: hypothetical protein H0X73_05495 [Chthoniobacterales bacterium]|nr:hypothetical protein [Chthoniobacterales bacterium]